MKRKQAILLLTLLIAWTVPAGVFARTLTSHAQAKDKAAKPQIFKLAGTVKSVDAKKRSLVVQHGDIPGFMSAMTMPYDAGKTEDLGKISAGDQIAADVVVSDGSAHLENIKVTGHAKGKDDQK